MKIILISRDKKVHSLFTEIHKSKSHEFFISGPDEMKKDVKKSCTDTLFFIDIAGFKGPERDKTLNFLSKQENINYGIIDTKGVIPDPAGLIHNGACDYLGKNSLKKNIPLNRIQKIIKFLNLDPPAEEKASTEQNNLQNTLIPAKGWHEITEGNEYTFCFMFIELDGQRELKSHFGKEQLSGFTGSFRNYIAGQAAKINGKIWMWMDFGGLILIPFDGKKVDAIQLSMELVVDRLLISIEQNFDRIISYRIALHIGNTEYKPRSETGNIVSDTINSIFHLGQKFSKPGSFVMTDRLFEFIPENLEDCFIDEGIYEGRCIKRMLTIRN